MNVNGINHFTIRTKLAVETESFYCGLLGLENGYRPPFKFPGMWLYSNGQPILHIIEITQNNEEIEKYLGPANSVMGSGAIDHIALHADDFQQCKSALMASGVEYEARDVPEQSIRQLFIQDPNDITIELIFIG